MLLTTWITTYHKKAPLMQDNVTWRSAITEQNINKYRHFYVCVSKKIIALTTFSITTRPWLSIIPFRVCTSRIPHRLYSLHVHKQTVSQAHTSWMKLFVCRHLPEKKKNNYFQHWRFYCNHSKSPSTKSLQHSESPPIKHSVSCNVYFIQF